MAALPATWWLRRLRAMSPAEVLHRAARIARQPLERARMATGRYARPSRSLRAHLDAWRGPAVWHVPPALAGLPLTPAAAADADDACAGTRFVLGLGRLELPRDAWHHEPRMRRAWPRVAAARALRFAPAGFDARLTWELNRGHAWVVLARAYAASHEARYHDELRRQLDSWHAANPIGTGINWASPMEAAIRIHSLAWAAAFLRGHDTPLLPRIAHAIHAHATFVADHLAAYSSANNHLVVELSGLVVAARALGAAELARRWLAPALDRLDRAVADQVLSDGVDAEMATHYHAFVLEALLLVAYLERAHAAPRPALEGVVRAMADHLDALALPDGSVLGAGDSDDGRLLPWCVDRHELQLVEAAAALDEPPTDPRDARPPTDLEGAFWISGGRVTRSPATRPRASRLFAASGQVVLRSTRVHAVFDAGPFGFGALAAHAHCDCLAISVALDGRPIVVDRGTYRYNGDAPARDRFRATSAHNTLQLGAREQATIGGPFLWSRKPTTVLERCALAPRVDLVTASHDGFAPARHRRTVERRGDVLTIRDEIDGPRGGDDAIVRFHLAPRLTVTPTPDGAGTRLVIHADAAVGTLWTDARRTRVVETLHSPRYGALEPALTIECELAPGRELTTIVTPADRG